MLTSELIREIVCFGVCVLHVGNVREALKENLRVESGMEEEKE